MRNNNRQVIRRLSMRSLKNNKMRNCFAIAAIALTCMLFTALAALGTGMLDAAQESTMREVGARYHAGLKAATQEQMEKVVSDERVKSYTWNIFISRADNLVKRQCELRLAQGTEELQNSFIELKEGVMPENEDDIIVDTYVMDELKVPHELGVEIPLEFMFRGEKISKTFRVCGWYEGIQLGHASEIYLSEAYWKQLKKNLTDADFKAWGEKHPEEEGVGLYAVGLYFDSPAKIEQTVCSVIESAGYEPDAELSYGVNWAYMQNRTESVDPLSLAILGGALAVILLTGYLIIYNIFYISVFQDIRFYGLLKTIGTTKKQIKRIILRQALVLSVIGIPIGLAAGYFAAGIFFPFLVEITAAASLGIKMSFHPAVAVFGILFALLTVFLGCRKPGKIAGSVSPVEAVRYTEGSGGRKKAKKSEAGAKIYRMAFSNLGRSKKKTTLVLLSLSFSMVLLCVVLTGVGSFRIDAYLEQRLVGDVLIASTNITGSGRGAGYMLDEEYVEMADAHDGILARNELWEMGTRSDIVLDETGMERYQQFFDQNLLRTSDEWSRMVVETARQQKKLEADIYAYDEPLLSKLKIQEGEFDIEKFVQGGYVLLTDIVGDHTEGAHVYSPGEKVTMLTVDEDSEFVAIMDEAGNTIDGYWENMKETECEVMAIVEIPHSMTDQSYPVNGVQLVLPKQMVRDNPYGECFGISYEAEEEQLDSFTADIDGYCENINRDMGYLTKESLMEGFGTMTTAIRMIGIALSAVIAFIGVLNFINSIVTGILSRKREFAILCSIGMTQQQLTQMLLMEGLYYVLIAGGISLILGTSVSWLVMQALNQVILFFEYRPNFLAFVIMLPILAVLAVVVPSAAYRKAQKESIVERLRETES